MMLRALSLGAGVQSTTLALMVKHGDIQPIDCAIFSDTAWEPKRVYRHLEWLEGILGYPVYRVGAGSLREGLEAGSQGKRWASIPAYTTDGIGQIRRQCTKEYKLVPIRRKVRELAGIYGKRSPKHPIVTQLIGISLDEAIRAKPSGETWRMNTWPLIERQMTRRDCYSWLEERQYPVVRPEDATPDRPTWPPKSACIGCPYRSDAAWVSIRDGDPEEWADAITVDRMIRTGFRNMKKQLFLHRSGKPLEQVKLTADERGQPDLFNNECEGMCGV